MLKNLWRGPVILVVVWGKCTTPAPRMLRQVKTKQNLIAHLAFFVLVSTVIWYIHLHASQNVKLLLLYIFSHRSSQYCCIQIVYHPSFPASKSYVLRSPSLLSLPQHLLSESRPHSTQSRLPWNSLLHLKIATNSWWFSCLSLPSAEITAIISELLCPLI